MPIIQEIPPKLELLSSIEEHAEGGLLVRIEFYQTANGDYFVWPYVREVKSGMDAMRHFMVQGHYPSKEDARKAALHRGKELIASGFDVHSLD